jgi:hypothetical protein
VVVYGGKWEWRELYQRKFHKNTVSVVIFISKFVCPCSRYGEIATVNLVRDKDTGKSRGFCFLCYEDQRSTILAVDNFNGMKVSIRQDIVMFVSISMTNKIKSIYVTNPLLYEIFHSTVLYILSYFPFNEL